VHEGAPLSSAPRFGGGRQILVLHVDRGRLPPRLGIGRGDDRDLLADEAHTSRARTGMSNIRAPPKYVRQSAP
jgi:hypothetical protein